jgi:hypothetical protein
VLPLAQKIFFASLMFVQILLLTTQPPKITKEGLQEARGLEKEAKNSFISLVRRFSS